MSSPEIKVIFLLSYDYEFIKYSLPLVYSESTKILISIDKNRISWTGNKYTFDESIIDWIKSFDIENKVTFFQENFYVPKNTPMENETRQRQMSADFLIKGGWTIQLDVDEYFINFKSFVDFLKSKSKYLIDPEKNQITVASNWIILFKQDLNGFFIIAGSKFSLRIATNFPVYSNARNVKCKTIFTRTIILHQSFARGYYDIKAKVENWGHANDILNPKEYIEFWDSINSENYKKVRNFSPFNPKTDFKKLEYLPAKSIKDLISYYEIMNLKQSFWYILRKNLVQTILNLPLSRTLYNYINELLYRRTYTGKAKQHDPNI